MFFMQFPQFVCKKMNFYKMPPCPSLGGNFKFWGLSGGRYRGADEGRALPCTHKGTLF